MAKGKNPVGKILYAVVLMALLYLDFLVYQSGQPVFAVILLAVTGLVAYVYANQKAYSYRYLFPSLMGFGIFVIVPLIYTIYIAFTNYSGTNLLSLQDVEQHFMRQNAVDVNESYPFKLYDKNGEYTICIQTTVETEAAATTQTTSKVFYYVSDSFKIPVTESTTLKVNESPESPAGDALKIPAIIKVRDSIKKLVLTVPGKDVEFQMNDFKTFAPTVKIWDYNKKEGTFKNRETGMVVKPNGDTGFFVDTNGQNVGPGFRVNIGLKNFTQIFTDESVRGPFITVFIWTIMFALISVIITFALGFLLAVLLEWKPLRFRNFWRSMVILPYAVPAFISILIFRGLFNPQFGDINTMLNALFGIRPEWTTDPMLARSMVLIVNLWLGYPYMMILCTGILQSVPGDIYEASAIDGGTPFSDLFKMTMPLILPPLKPLLIASFAFNFNNFLLIQLLTGGAPQIVGASTAVGYTDVLVTYTFNLAFRNAGANYGFASAIATIIFVIVSILSYVNLKAAMRGDQEKK